MLFFCSVLVVFVVSMFVVFSFFFTNPALHTALDKENALQERTNERLKKKDENLRDYKARRNVHIWYLNVHCAARHSALSHLSQETYRMRNKIEHRKSIIKLTNEKYKFVLALFVHLFSFFLFFYFFLFFFCYIRICICIWMCIYIAWPYLCFL